ncbi:hypothetical protein Tco_1319155 [Tanacetum coccineum]
MNVGFAKWSSDTVKKHEAHSNGHVLDDVILSDPEGEGHHETPLFQDNGRAHKPSEFPSNGEAETTQNVDKASSLVSRVFRLFKFVNDSHALISPTALGTHLPICCGGGIKIEPLPATAEEEVSSESFFASSAAAFCSSIAFSLMASDVLTKPKFSGAAHERSATKWQILLSPTASQNIAILLRLLNVMIEDVYDALLQGNSDTLGTELLASLLMMDPRTNTGTLSAGFCMQRRCYFKLQVGTVAVTLRWKLGSCPTWSAADMTLDKVVDYIKRETNHFFHCS